MYKKLFIEKTRRNTYTTTRQQGSHPKEIHPKDPKTSSIFFPGVLAKQQGSLHTNTKFLSKFNTEQDLLAYSYSQRR